MSNRLGAILSKGISNDILDAMRYKYGFDLIKIENKPIEQRIPANEKATRFEGNAQSVNLSSWVGKGTCIKTKKNTIEKNKNALLIIFELIR